MKTLVEEKAKGKRIVTRPSQEAPEGKAVNLLEALRKSLKSGGEGASPAKKPEVADARRRRRRPESQPIARAATAGA